MPLSSAQTMDFDQLSSFFHLPINDASKELGICTTLLKKICRRNGIARWPYRKIRSLDKRIATLEIAIVKNPEAEKQLNKEISTLHDKRKLLMKKPSGVKKGKISKLKCLSDSDFLTTYNMDSPASSSGSDDSPLESPRPAYSPIPTKETNFHKFNSCSNLTMPTSRLQNSIDITEPTYSLYPEAYTAVAPIELSLSQEANFINLINNDEPWNWDFGLDTFNSNKPNTSNHKEEVAKDLMPLTNSSFLTTMDTDSYFFL
jgi:hypothetical protein